MSLFILVNFHDLKSSLSAISIATPALFRLLFTWNVFLYAFTFNLFVSLDCKWVSCRQHIAGSCVFIHSTNICLLTEEYQLTKFLICAGTVLGPGNKAINKTETVCDPRAFVCSWRYTTLKNNYTIYFLTIM